MHVIEQSAKPCHSRRDRKRRDPGRLQADLLEALKQSLRDLDNLKILRANDLETLNLRRSPKEQIAAIERRIQRFSPRPAAQ